MNHSPWEKNKKEYIVRYTINARDSAMLGNKNPNKFLCISFYEYFISFHIFHFI